MKVRKLTAVLCALAVVVSSSGGLPFNGVSLFDTAITASAEDLTISQGQYIRMGSYNGEDVDWFCYKVNSTGTMMLSKYVLKTSSFGSNATYTQSNIYKWLDSDANGTFESELGLTNAEKEIIRTVDLSGSYGDGTDRFIIPAYGNNELNSGSVNPITQYIYNKTATAEIVWLRTPRDANNARVVRSIDANVTARYSGVSHGRGVRPMFYLDTDVIKNMGVTGSGTEDDPYVFEPRYSLTTEVPTGGGTVSAKVSATRDGINISNAVLPNKLVAGADVTLTLTPTPNTGYDFKNFSFTSDGSPFDVTKKEDGTYSFTMPEKGVVISAEFEKQKFTVNWNNYDGSALEKDENVEYGTIPTYDGDTPTKASDSEYFYTFSGWSPEVGSITANTTYTAQFVANSPTYTITIPESVNIDGGKAEFKAENVTLSDGAKINITVDGDNTESGQTTFNAKNEAKDSTVSYTINNGSADVADGGTALTFTEGGTQTLSFAKKADSTPTYAGKHTETLTFGISVAEYVPSLADAFEDGALINVTLSVHGTQRTYRFKNENGTFKPTDTSNINRPKVGLKKEDSGSLVVEASGYNDYSLQTARSDNCLCIYTFDTQSNKYNYVKQAKVIDEAEFVSISVNGTEIPVTQA